MNDLPNWDFHSWVTLVSALSQLVLATIAVTRISKSPLAWPLALVCLAHFVSNLAEAGHDFTGARPWIWLDTIAASLLPPLGLSFARAFVGRSGPSWTLRLLFLYSAVLAGASATAFVGVEAGRSFAGSPTWAAAIAPELACAAGLMFLLLFTHLGSSQSVLERGRTRLVILGATLSVLGGVCDLLADLGLSVPRLGSAGQLLMVLAFTLVALRLGLLDRRISWLFAANALFVGLLQLGGYLVVFQFFGGNSTLLLVATVTLTLALAPAFWVLLRDASTHRERLNYYATLGRLAAQMAHDIRNPVTAIRATADYLMTEVRQGRPIDELSRLERIHQQADRIESMVASYQRMGRVEPHLVPMQLATLASRVTEAQKAAAPAGVTLVGAIALDLPPLQGDEGLLSTALENLIRNAFEALAEKGGTVTVRLGAAGAGWLELSVADDGPGMDARVAGKVFEEFFTTKTSGSGLGLAYVRRVAEAHGGTATLQSEEGKGTTLTLRLPVA